MKLDSCLYLDTSPHREIVEWYLGILPPIIGLGFREGTSSLGLSHNTPQTKSKRSNQEIKHIQLNLPRHPMH